MRSYNNGISRRLFGAVFAAVIFAAGVFAVAIYFPSDGNGIPPNPTNLGFEVAEYLNSKREDVQFYFMCNSTFVNENITNFYAQTEPSAYVDAIVMNRTASGGDIQVLFSPWQADIVGTGQISTEEWNSLGGAIVDDGIGQMEAPEDPPTDSFPTSWPIDFYFYVYFDDGSYFFAGFAHSDGLLYIHNGTWSGEFGTFGWPINTGGGPGMWLLEGGYLSVGMNALYEAITANVSYPE